MTPIFEDPMFVKMNYAQMHIYHNHTKRHLLLLSQRVLQSQEVQKLQLCFLLQQSVLYKLTGKMFLSCVFGTLPILLNYKLQEKDKAPNQEDFPRVLHTIGEM